MNVIIILCIALMALFIIDKGICFIYCFTKKKMSASKRTIVKQEEVNKHKKGVKQIIKSILYGWIMYTINRLGKFPSQKYRLFILKHIYHMDIGKNVVIYHGFHIRAPWNIKIGKGTIIGENAFLDGRNGILIGDNVNISSGVFIFTEQHDINDPYFRSAESGGQVTVDDRAWLSSRTTILPKVHVGEGSVLASGGLATKDLAPYSLYGGIPAKKIGERSKDLRYEFNGEYVPFF